MNIGSASFQLGLDVATSIAILFSALTFLYQARKTRKLERERGIDQHTRAHAASVLNRICEEAATEFIQKIVSAQSKLMKTAGFPLYETAEEAANHLASDNWAIDAKREAEEFRHALGEFYELLSARKYSIFPVLDPLDENSSSSHVEKIRGDISDVADHYNNLGSSYFALIAEVSRLVDFVKENKISNENFSGLEEEKAESIHKKSVSIILDKDYFHWVQTFVPSGQEARFESIVMTLNINSDRDNQFLNEVIANFLAHMVNKPDEMLAQVIRTIAASVQSSATECKEVLCGLAAVHAVLLDKNDLDISQMTEKFESDKYFNIRSDIR